MNKLLTPILCVALGGGAFLISADARASCAWTVKGKLAVDHRMGKLIDKYGTSALANVEVKVSAKEKVLGVWGTWNAWSTVRSKADGSFTVNHTKNCDGRRFKVEVKFADDDLEVRHEHATSSLTKVKWYTILEEVGGEHAAGTTNVGTKTFRPGGARDLGDFEARSHADIWVLYKKAIATAASYGGAYAFSGQVKVKYPHNSAVVGDDREASYCNPTTKVIYIHKGDERDNFNVGTLLHELGHKWAYDHNSGEICLTETLLLNGDTHGLVGDHCVAFHEGWAEFFSNEMERAILGGDKELPYSRPNLNNGVGEANTPLTSESLLQRHDLGWWSVFHALSTPLLHKYDFGTAASGAPSGRIAAKTMIPLNCSSPDISFKEVMRVFLPGGTYTKHLSRGETTLEGFLERAAARLPGLTDAQGETIEKLVNPASAVQPSDEFCSAPTVKKQPFGGL